MKIAVALVIAFFTCLSSHAELRANGLGVKSDFDSHFVSLGPSYFSIKSGSTSITSIGIAGELRGGIGRATPYTYSFSLVPTFSSSALLTVQIHAMLGFRLMGRPAYTYQVSDGDSVIALSKVPASSFMLYLNAGMSIMPIFGQLSTATYTGPGGSLSAYIDGEWPLQVTFTYSSLSLVSRKATAYSLGVSYFWSVD